MHPYAGDTATPGSRPVPGRLPHIKIYTTISTRRVDATVTQLIDMMVEQLLDIRRKLCSTATN
jgi:hypothetical protein